MRIAIVGSGVAGLVCAWQLHQRHDVIVLEGRRRPGGHVRTIVVEDEGGAVPVDTGFIVFNEPRYPGFTALLAELGIATQESEMSFSVSCAVAGLEYHGSLLGSLLVRPATLLSSAHLSMLRDIPRFNRAARALVSSSDVRRSLGDLVDDERLSRHFVDHYLVPLGASIWSADPSQV
ncbi:MAG TPA: FAD-dependent oxidoreductase, partial [Acidimicrobiales bacterium]|nr:FAD-dependent oxidoreductase [Acidimicrobiales bacterium]